MIATNYEDNFGFYYLDDPEEREFFAHIVNSSHWCRCARCDERVRLLPRVFYCARCVECVEFGGDKNPGDTK